MILSDEASLQSFEAMLRDFLSTVNVLIGSALFHIGLGYWCVSYSVHDHRVERENTKHLSYPLQQRGRILN